VTVISEKTLIQKLKYLGIERNDVVYVHSDLFQFGFFKDSTESISLCLNQDTLFRSLMEILGENGTICIPAFTSVWYSKTPIKNINTGLFSKYIAQLPESKKTRHGMLSIASIGKFAKDICSKSLISSFTRQPM